MAIPKVLDRIMRTYTAEVDPFEGQGANGAVYGDTVSWPCYAEPVRARTRSTDAAVTRATARVWTFLDSTVKVGDRIRVGPHAGYVLSVADFSSRGQFKTPDHKEVSLG